MPKKISLLFLLSFLLNLVWENLHSLLYLHYKGGAISEFILVRATLSDALYITGAAIVGLFLKTKYRVNVAVGILLLISIIIERFALGTGRWAYSESMPMIPLIRTGLTPTIQLALLGYITFKVTRFFDPTTLKT